MTIGLVYAMPGEIETLLTDETRTPIRTEAGSLLCQLYGPLFSVNSAHHQAVGVFGEGLQAAQYGPDFVVEALYHERLPVLGVQWHPERMCFSHAREDVEDGSKLLKYYLRMLR